MFNNVRFYRIQSDWPGSEAGLCELLEKAAFAPCGSFSERSIGFEAPVEDEVGALARRLAGADIVQLRRQTKVLPAGAVKEALDERIAAYKERTRTTPSRKEKRDLKDEVYAELLPKALVKSERIRACYLLSEQILMVATASENVAEEVLDVLRDVFGSLQAIPLQYKRGAHTLLTKIFLGDGPAQFGLGRECRMKDASEPKSSVNWSDMDLADASVRKHVVQGLTLDRLGVQFDGLLRGTIDGDLVLRKLRLEGIEELDDLDDEDPLARHDAEFTLWCGLLTRLLEAFKKQLGGYA